MESQPSIQLRWWRLGFCTRAGSHKGKCHSDKHVKNVFHSGARIYLCDLIRRAEYVIFDFVVIPFRHRGPRASQRVSVDNACIIAIAWADSPLYRRTISTSIWAPPSSPPLFWRYNTSRKTFLIKHSFYSMALAHTPSQPADHLLLFTFYKQVWRTEVRLYSPRRMCESAGNVSGQTEYKPPEPGTGGGDVSLMMEFLSNCGAPVFGTPPGRSERRESETRAACCLLVLRTHNSV